MPQEGQKRKPGPTGNELGRALTSLLPTPRASANENGQMRRTPSQEAGTHGRSLAAEMASLLPTPNASLSNYGEDPETWEKRRAEAAERHGNNGLGVPLPIAVKRLLPTPAAQDGSRGGDFARAAREGSGGDDLLTTMARHEAALLPTPEASDGSGGRVSKEKGGTRPSGAKRAVTLSTAIHHLPTPTSNDARDPGASPSQRRRKNPGLVARLDSTGESSSPPSGAGRPSSAGLRLNPSFVEWMMGAPAGWTDPDCPLSATEFSSKPATSSGATCSTSSEQR